MWGQLIGAGLSLGMGLFKKKPDLNKGFQDFMKQPQVAQQYGQADKAFTGVQDYYERLMSGDPGLRRSLFAGTMFDMDRAGQAEARKLDRSTSVQRGGALTLGKSNIARDIFAAKQKAIGEAQNLAPQGLADIGTRRNQLFNTLVGARQMTGQQQLTGEQMTWNQGMDLGEAFQGFLGSEGGKKASDWLKNIFGGGKKKGPFSV